VLLACYVVLYGYAMGGNATLQASLVAEAFGRGHFGAISSRLVPFVVAAQAIGVPATGYLRDVTGGFSAALATIIVASLVAAVVVLRGRPPPTRPWRPRERARSGRPPPPPRPGPRPTTGASPPPTPGPPH